MTYRRSRPLAILGLVSALVGGCSQSAEAPAERTAHASAVRPSAAEMRAARLLSLSNNSALDAKSDPYDLAVTCVDAIGTLGARLATSTILNDQQKRALAAAKRVYEKKAMDAGGKTQNEVTRDVEARQASDEDVKQRILAGISCIREIA